MSDEDKKAIIANHANCMHQEGVGIAEKITEKKEKAEKRRKRETQEKKFYKLAPTNSRNKAWEMRNERVGKYISADSQIERLKIALGVSTNLQLAKKLGLSKSTVSVWKRDERNGVPASVMVEVAIKYKISLDWLILGRKPLSQKELLESEDKDKGLEIDSCNG